MSRFSRFLVAMVFIVSGAAAAINRPASPTPVRTYVEQIDVGDPARYQNLTVFPVTLPRNVPAGVETLDDAIRSHQLIISEIGSGRVNTLSVENVGKTPVFIMAGEVLEGAKQNRVLQNDVLVPPHSGRLDIGAFCVEHGRWTYQDSDRNFKSDGIVVNPAVRASAQESKDQGAVWNEVENTHKKLGVPSTTGAINEAYAAPRVRRDITGFVEALQAMPDRNPRMVGAVVVVGSRILAADSFGDRHLLVALWPKLVRSYALEALSDPDGTRGVSTQAARDFLARVFDATLERQVTPGTGELYDVQGRRCSGSALVYEKWPLHLALFPKSEVRPDYPRPEEDNVPPLQRTYPR